MMAIINSGINGIAASTLAHKTGLSLETIGNICKKLEDEKMVKTKIKGKWRTYYATAKSAKDEYLRSLLLTNELYQKIMRFNVSVSSQKIDFSNGNMPSIDHSPLIITKFEESDWLEKKLFEFTTRIGLMITYFAFQAMSRTNYPLQAVNYDKWDRHNRDKLVERWFSEIVQPGRILWTFRRTIPYHTDFVSDNPTEEEQRKFHETPNFELDEIAIKRLTEAFKRLYPSAYEELDRIQKELPERLDKWKEL